MFTWITLQNATLWNTNFAAIALEFVTIHMESIAMDHWDHGNTTVLKSEFTHEMITLIAPARIQWEQVRKMPHSFDEQLAMFPTDFDAACVRVK